MLIWRVSQGANQPQFQGSKMGVESEEGSIMRKGREGDKTSNVLRPSYVVKPTWVEGQQDDVYHADKSAVSSSQLRRILKSPAAFKANFFDGFKLKETAAFKFGKVVHSVIVEDASLLSTYAVMPSFKEFGHHASKVHKAKKAEWLAANAGKQVVTSDDFKAIHGMLESVLQHKDACVLLKNGLAEVSGYYQDLATGIRCRIRPDFMNKRVNAIVDLKTTDKASMRSFQKSIWNYRYDFQLAHYGVGYESIEGTAVDFHAFICVEKEPPFECAVYVADRHMIDRGKEDYRKALDLLSVCLERDHWPQSQTQMQTISLPRYADNTEEQS